MDRATIIEALLRVEREARLVGEGDASGGMDLARALADLDEIREAIAREQGRPLPAITRNCAEVLT